MDVHGVDLPISEPGTGLQYITDRNKRATPHGNQTHTVTVASPETHDLPTPGATPAPPEEPIAAKAAEPFVDPETLETIAKPTRGDRRHARLWQEREAERQMRQAAEKRVTDLETELRGRPAAASASTTTPAADEADDPAALTMAAQARIRPKPDRAAIGSTYATYEDYVEDCAIWGGELAAEKRDLIRHSHEAQTAADRAQTAFAQERLTAKADYPDFDHVTSQPLSINQAIWDATVNAPAGLKGHVLYWLGKHPDETARIAQLASGPALVAMGEVIATVRAARTTEKPAAPVKHKPQSDAPDPPEPIKGATSHDTPLHRVADPGASRVNPVDFIKSRNAEVGSRRRI